MALTASNIAMWSIACPRAFEAFRSCFSTAMASALAFQSMMTSLRAAVADSARAPLIQIARENLDIGFHGTSPFKVALEVRDSSNAPTSADAAVVKKR